MPPRPASTTDGFTRRQLLKRGAALGVASLWITPAVQVVRMSRAQAADTSGSACTTYCMKVNVATGVWQPLGTGTDINPANHNCLTCPDGSVNGLPGGEQPEGFSLHLTAEGGYIVKYPITWSLLVLDSTPDEFTGTATAAARCGPGNAALSCSYVGPDNESFDVDPGFRVLEIPRCPSANNKPITQIELLIQHCPESADA